MNTFILNAETSSLSINHLLKQAEAGGVEVRDVQFLPSSCRPTTRRLSAIPRQDGLPGISSRRLGL